MSSSGPWPNNQITASIEFPSVHLNWKKMY